MKPTKSILDRTFRYTPAHDTNIRLRFMRERARLEVERRMRGEPELEPAPNVVPLRKAEP